MKKQQFKNFIDFLKRHPALFVFLIIVVAIIAFCIGVKIKHHLSDKKLVEERKELSEAIGPYLSEHMPDDDFTVNSADGYSWFKVIGEGSTHHDFWGNKKYSWYDWYDNFTVKLYVDDYFDELSDKEKYKKMQKWENVAKGEYSDCKATVAPYYDSRFGASGIGYYAEDIFPYQKIHVYVYTSQNVYGYTGESYILYKNGHKVNLWSDFHPKTTTNNNSSSSGKKKSSGSTYYYSSPTYDPDDYDSPEDFADDAWGDEFDDWDDAYDYWEDNE